ncbi:DUF5994 family protein [Nonomuraea salmonea]|uniref:DUF5994 family protein n=1 Tax=Nonomuraea salmonea TaxID=46181 RepID=A0ABV5NI65_9ACTN
MPNRRSPTASLISLRPARLFLEPTLTRDGTLDGAWWPHSTDLRRELPAFVRALEDRIGPVLRVGLDSQAWDEVPAHLVVDGRFVRISGHPATPHTIRVIRGGQDGFLLLVIPPDTAGSVAATAMRTAARTGNTLSAHDILATPGTLPPDAEWRMRRYRDSDRAAVEALALADALAALAFTDAVALPDALAAAGVLALSPASAPAVADACELSGLDGALGGHVAGTAYEEPEIHVLEGPGGRVLGAVAYALRRDRAAGRILWLHGGEVPEVVEALVRRALSGMGGVPVHAFTDEPGGRPGTAPAALPAGRRAVTLAVFEREGFVARDSWRQLRRTSPCEPGAGPYPMVDVVVSGTPRGWWLKAPGDDAAAALVAQEPVGGRGVVWWLGADAGHADPDLERALLLRADALLTEHGARETVLYAAGDPEPSWELFTAAGFTEIDRLASFTRPATPAGAPADHPAFVRAAASPSADRPSADRAASMPLPASVSPSAGRSSSMRSAVPASSAADRSFFARSAAPASAPGDRSFLP